MDATPQVRCASRRRLHGTLCHDEVGFQADAIHFTLSHVYQLLGTSSDLTTICFAGKKNRSEERDLRSQSSLMMPSQQERVDVWSSREEISSLQVAPDARRVARKRNAAAVRLMMADPVIDCVLINGCRSIGEERRTDTCRQRGY